MNKRWPIGYFCLLIYFLSWVGSAQAIPLLLVSAGHAHRMILTDHGDEIRIALHHPGHVDEHEPAPATSLESYRHDLLDRVLWAFSGSDNRSYSDHVIHISLDKPPILAASKIVDSKEVKLSIAFFFSGYCTPFPAFAKLTRLPHSGQPPPVTPSIPIHLRTTVLLN